MRTVDETEYENLCSFGTQADMFRRGISALDSHHVARGNIKTAQSSWRTGLNLELSTILPLLKIELYSPGKSLHLFVPNCFHLLNDPVIPLWAIYIRE